MIRYAKEKGIEDVIMNTNAVLLTEQLSKELILSGLDRIFFSIDSPIKEEYEKIRVGAKFEDVMFNVRRFNEIRSELGSLNPLTRASMVLIPSNESSFNSFIEKFSSIVDIVSHNDLLDHTQDYSRLKERTDIQFCCQEFWLRFFVRVDGEIGVCCFDTDASFGLGNIKNTTIKEVWNSDAYQKLRERHKNSEWHKLGLCQSCPAVLMGTSGDV